MVKPAREKVNIWHPAETTEPGKTSLLNAHSVSGLKLRDRSSAETLDVPGICAAGSQFPRLIAQDQMVPLMLSEGKDLLSIPLI